MTDNERELHIKSCGDLMTQAYAQYEASSCFGDKGSADGWRMCMERAVAARSPAQVARMEAERGLS